MRLLCGATSLQVLIWYCHCGLAEVPSGQRSPPSGPKCCKDGDAAASKGHLGCLQQLWETGCSLTTATPCSAARNGHWDIVLWAYQHGCPTCTWVCTLACRAGAVEVLQAVESTASDKQELRAYVAGVAAESGQLGVLHWACHRPSRNSARISC